MSTSPGIGGLFDDGQLGSLKLIQGRSFKQTVSEKLIHGRSTGGVTVRIGVPSRDEREREQGERPRSREATPSPSSSGDPDSEPLLLDSLLSVSLELSWRREERRQPSTKITDTSEHDSTTDVVEAGITGTAASGWRALQAMASSTRPRKSSDHSDTMPSRLCHSFAHWISRQAGGRGPSPTHPLTHMGYGSRDSIHRPS